MKPVPDIYCRFGKDRQVSELYTLKVDFRVALAIDFEPAYSLFIVLYSTFLFCGESVISVRDLRVSYSASGKPILDGLDARFAPGRFSAIVGPNGCGKSTLLKAIMGFLPVNDGAIELDGQPIPEIGRRALARRIAYLPQENHCPDYITLGELVELGGYARFPLFGGPKPKDLELFEWALETVGLRGMEGVRVSTLSGGQRQRAWIAMVLAQDTNIILLDEPVNHLDLKYQYAALDMVKSLSLKNQKTVVAVLHDLNLATTFADDVVLLKNGRAMGAGPIGQTMTSEAIEQVFGLQTDIFEREGRLICVPRHDPQYMTELDR